MSPYIIFQKVIRKRCHLPRKIFLGAICLLLVQLLCLQYFTAAACREDNVLAFSSFQTCEKWRFDNAAGRMDFIIYSVMYVNKKKKKKYIKEKKNHTVVLCLGMDFHLFFFFFFTPLQCFSGERSFLYEPIQLFCFFLTCSFIFSLSLSLSLILFFIFSVSVFLSLFLFCSGRNVIFYCVEVSSFRFMLFVCHNDCRNNCVVRDDDVMCVSRFNRFCFLWVSRSNKMTNR